jgi:hypothetical protein
MADCGMLMMGVPNSDPNTPPLEMVKVPPVISSRANAPSLACGLCGVELVLRVGYRVWRRGGVVLGCVG